MKNYEAACSSLRKAVEKVKTLQDFLLTVDGQIRIRPKDLAVGIVDDIFIYARDALEVFEEESPDDISNEGLCMTGYDLNGYRFVIKEEEDSEMKE